MNFYYCPRCGDKAYECLASYSYCAGCNYSPTTDEKYDYPIPAWALEVLKEGELSEEPMDALLLGYPSTIVGFVSREIPEEESPTDQESNMA